MAASVEEVQESFRKIYEKAQSLGLKHDDLASLNSVKRLRCCSKIAQLPAVPKKFILFGVLVGFLAVFAGVFHLELYSRRGLAKFWLTVYHNYNLEKEKCIFLLPDKMIDVFRPPVDCSMCKDVVSVDRVKSLEYHVFEEKYAYSGRPVVVVDGAKNWTAMEVFSFDFFRSVYSEDSPVLENFEKNCQFFPYKTEFRNLREVFQMSMERAQMTDGSKPWYIGWYVIC